MTNTELANKLTARLEFMKKQYCPAPTCANKKQAHEAMVREVKRLVAQNISPQNNGLQITVTV